MGHGPKSRSDAIQMEFMAKLCVRHKYARHMEGERERKGERVREWEWKRVGNGLFSL